MLRIWPQVRSIRVSRNYTETNVPDTSPGFELTGIHCIYSPVQRKFPELNSNRSKRDLFLLYTPHCTIFDVIIFFVLFYDEDDFEMQLLHKKDLGVLPK